MITSFSRGGGQRITLTQFSLIIALHNTWGSENFRNFVDKLSEMGMRSSWGGVLPAVRYLY